MPRHKEPKKDVTNYEKRRGVVSKQRSVDVRMGKPGSVRLSHCIYAMGERSELKHLSSCRKRKQQRF